MEEEVKISIENIKQKGGDDVCEVENGWNVLMATTEEIFDSSGKKLVIRRSYTNELFKKFKTLNEFCPLSFNSYRLNNVESRDLEAPLLIVSAFCKFESCNNSNLKFIIYKEDYLIGQPLIKVTVENLYDHHHVGGLPKRRCLSKEERLRLGREVMQKGASRVQLEMLGNLKKNVFDAGNFTDSPTRGHLQKMKDEYEKSLSLQLNDKVDSFLINNKNT